MAKDDLIKVGNVGYTKQDTLDIIKRAMKAQKIDFDDEPRGVVVDIEPLDTTMLEAEIHAKETPKCIVVGTGKETTALTMAILKSQLKDVEVIVVNDMDKESTLNEALASQLIHYIKAPECMPPIPKHNLTGWRRNEKRYFGKREY